MLALMIDGRSFLGYESLALSNCRGGTEKASQQSVSIGSIYWWKFFHRRPNLVIRIFTRRTSNQWKQLLWWPFAELLIRPLLAKCERHQKTQGLSNTATIRGFV